MNVRHLKNYWNFPIRNSTACSSPAETTTARSGASSGASPAAAPDATLATAPDAAQFAARWIELAPSRVAGAALAIVYGLVLGTAPWLQMPGAVVLFIALAIVAHALWYIRSVVRRARVSALGVEPRRGLVACRMQHLAKPVSAFRIEHVFCYYLQMHVLFADGEDRRLCIVGDRVKPRDFQYLCMCVSGYRDAGWIRAPARAA